MDRVNIIKHLYRTPNYVYTYLLHEYNFFRKMKNVIWIILNCTFILNLITASNCNEHEDELNVYLKSSNYTVQETFNVSIL